MRGQILAVLSAIVTVTVVAIQAEAANISTVLVVPMELSKQLGNGDANGDGVISCPDTDLINLHLKGKAVITQEVVLRGDVNFNGRLDLDDVQKIQNVYRFSCTAAGVPATSPQNPLPRIKYLPGDANGNGMITIADTVTIVNYLNNRSVGTNQQGQLVPLAFMLYNADCNRDGIIDQRDVDGIAGGACGGN